MYVSAIILAAGKGVRFGSKIPKPLIKISSKPILRYSLDTLNRIPSVREIILVVNSRNKKGISEEIKRHPASGVIKQVFGGLRRQDSLGSGLKLINTKADLVLIHDAARPFIDKRMVLSVIAKAQKSGAAIVGVPVKATIKKIKIQNSKFKIVEKTIDRNGLWEIQTPQVFRKGLILKAYEKFGKLEVTDDAMLVEKFGAKVSIVLGSYNNIKITTPEDLIIARAIARNLKK